MKKIVNLWALFALTILMQLLVSAPAGAQDSMGKKPKPRESSSSVRAGSITAQPRWNLDVLPSAGLQYCHISVAKAANSMGKPSAVSAVGDGSFVITAQAGVSTQVLITCKSVGHTEPESLIDSREGVDRPTGHALWFCPTDSSTKSCDFVGSEGEKLSGAGKLIKDGMVEEVVWKDGDASDSIKLRWVVYPADASTADLAAAKSKADQASDKADGASKAAEEANKKAEVAEERADKAYAVSSSSLLSRNAGLRLGYSMSIDTSGSLPERSGVAGGIEGYFLGDDSPFKLSLGIAFDSIEWQVPTAYAPNLQQVNQYTDGRKSFIGLSVGVNWMPTRRVGGDGSASASARGGSAGFEAQSESSGYETREAIGLVLDARLALGYQIRELGTQPLSQTIDRQVFISPSQTDRPITGRLELGAGYAIADVFLVGLQYSLTRNLEETRLSRGFELPGYESVEGHETDHALIFAVGLIGTL